ncbi:MAG: ABC transporter permease [Gemmatimonadota bacterium]
MLAHLLQDLRYSGRTLVRNPVFTVVVVATLALGIGFNAAAFSAIHGILLRPLAGAADSHQLVQIYRSWPGMEFGSVSIPHYQDLRDRAGEAFQDVAAYFFTPVSLSMDGGNERVLGMGVSANFFQTYGVTPALGRAFIPGEESVGPGGHPVAILGHGFWQSRFGGDPGVLGSTILLNGRPWEVVGVAPPDFKGPVNFASVPVYMPLMMEGELNPGSTRITARGSNMMTAVGRLRDDRSMETAQQLLDGLLAQLAEEHPQDYELQVGHALVPQDGAGIHPTIRGAQMAMSTVIMAVVGLLLLMACLNVANLFLARARDRRREMGVRLSLGASRDRIIQQLLTESLLFSLLGGAVGLGLAFLVLRGLAGVRPPMDGPWDFTIAMDSTVLLFALGLSVATGVLFGLVPALQASRPDTMSAVKGEAETRSGRFRAGNALVVGQLAVSVVLLLSAGLFLRSLQGATQIDPGFQEPGNLVVASMDPGLQGYDADRSRVLLDDVLQATAALPGVTAVGMTDVVPLGLSSSDRGVEIPGYDFAEGELRSLLYARVTEGYLEAMGVALVEGRTFTAQDGISGPPVIMVNRRFAERFWPGESAVGRTVISAGEERTVIGVVETGKYRSLGEDPTEYMYFPQRELFTTGMTLVVRTAREPSGVLQDIRRMVASQDPTLPLFDVRTMEDHMGIALMPARLGGTVLGAFGLLGLALATVGIYGVMAYSVARRRRELGIRKALGADRRRIVRLVLGEGSRLTALGLVLGLVAAFGAARLMSGMLYNVSAVDPVAFSLVPLILAAVATLAIYIPARRAAGVEPMGVLKGE